MRTLVDQVGDGCSLRPSVPILSKTVSVDRCIGLAVEHRSKWLNRRRFFLRLQHFFPSRLPRDPPTKIRHLAGHSFRVFSDTAVRRFHPYPSEISQEDEIDFCISYTSSIQLWNRVSGFHTTSRASSYPRTAPIDTGSAFRPAAPPLEILTSRR